MCPLFSFLEVTNPEKQTGYVHKCYFWQEMLNRQADRQTEEASAKRKGEAGMKAVKLWQRHALGDMTGVISKNEYASGSGLLITFLLLWPHVFPRHFAVWLAVKQHSERITGAANACNLLPSQHKTHPGFKSQELCSNYTRSTDSDQVFSV